jgi:serine/threonine protein kinase
MTQLREMITLSENDHPATQELIAFSFGSTSDIPMQIATDFFPNGDLDQALRKARTGKGATLNATMKSMIIFGIVSGMCSLHARGIFHSNLEPGTVFLNERYEPIIGGFDVCHLSDCLLIEDRLVEFPVFIPPELYGEGFTIDFSFDIYSFAVTLYCIFAEAMVLDDDPTPIGSPEHFMRRVRNGARFVRRPEIPEYHWGVIVRCWHHDPEARPTFQELLKEFHESHNYILPKSNVRAVHEYEDRVGSHFGDPNVEGLKDYPLGIVD